MPPQVSSVPSEPIAALEPRPTAILIASPNDSGSGVVAVAVAAPGEHGPGEADSEALHHVSPLARLKVTLDVLAWPQYRKSTVFPRTALRGSGAHRVGANVTIPLRACRRRCASYGS